MDSLTSSAGLRADDDPQPCVNAAVGLLCQTDKDQFIEYLKVDVAIVDWGVGRLQISDANNTNGWRIEKAGMINPPGPHPMYLLEHLGFEYQTSPFNFRFRRDVSDELYFDNFKRSIIMMDRYLEIGFTFPT